MIRRAKWILIGSSLFNLLLTQLLVKKGEDFYLLEQDAGLGGQQTWTIHADGFSSQLLQVLSPIIGYQWKAQSIFFPDFNRKFDSNLLCIRSNMISDFFLNSTYAERFLLRTKVLSIDGNRCETTQGSFQGQILIDSRTWDSHIVRSGEEIGSFGFQKYVGLDFEFDHPHGILDPCIMDARVALLDGFRYMHVLPLNERQLMVGDTRVSNNNILDEGSFLKGIFDYVEQHIGVKSHKILRTEKSVSKFSLRAPCGPSIKKRISNYDSCGVFFHPTERSLEPLYLRNLEKLCLLKSQTELDNYLVSVHLMSRKQKNFNLILNKILFSANEPLERLQIFSNFYQFDHELISRFFASQSTWFDRIKILNRLSKIKKQRV